MLSREDNEILTRVGPGTLMGSLLRRYWLPACLSSEVAEPDGPPARGRASRRPEEPPAPAPRTQAPPPPLPPPQGDLLPHPTDDLRRRPRSVGPDVLRWRPEGSRSDAATVAVLAAGWTHC